MHQRTLPTRALPNGDRVETVIFKGIRFRRYPDAPGLSERRYFVPGIQDRQRGVKRLHEEVWMEENGATIPPGYHVHHSDHDPMNNEPSNLVLITAEEHLDHHNDEWSKDPEMLSKKHAAVAKAREAAKAWHGSTEGRAWHSEHGRKVMAARELTQFSCRQCGKVYSSLNRGEATRFCSNACKSAWRREAGLDDVDRVCVMCGAEFRINKYRTTQTCSRSCSTSYGHSKKNRT